MASGIPLGLVGGVLALWLRSLPFTVSSAIGFIALSGVASLSHFSQAFCATMGCCPGLYPLGLTRSTGMKAAAGSHPASATRRQ